MEDKFRKVEEEFRKLKSNLSKGIIGREEFKKKAEELMIKDEEGRYWMLGIQSGKWYYYDGTQWVQSTPPYIEVMEKEKRIICEFCETENEETAIFCVSCGNKLITEKKICPRCGSTLKNEYRFCAVCGLSLEKAEDEHSFKFKKLAIGPSFLFSGGMGVILGAIFGVLIGASDYFYSFVTFLPLFLRNIQGRFMGGLVYGVLGAFFGFVFIGVCGLLLILLANLISSLFGGFKITFTKK